MRKTEQKPRSTNHHVPPEFKINEFYEVILRCRDDDDPRWKTFSEGTQRTALIYEEQKLRASKKAA